MKKILKTMLPIAGVACAAAPLVAMTSCGHDCKFVKDVYEGVEAFAVTSLAAGGTQISVEGFEIKDYDENLNYAFDHGDGKITGTCTKEWEESLAEDAYDVYRAEGEKVVILLNLTKEGIKLKDGDFFTVSFKMHCLDKDKKELWTSDETLKAIYKDSK